jgi:hypothetical protein
LTTTEDQQTAEHAFVAIARASGKSGEFFGDLHGTGLCKKTGTRDKAARDKGNAKTFHLKLFSGGCGASRWIALYSAVLRTRR